MVKKFTFLIDHSRSGVVYNFSGVRMYVCLSVCNMLTFESIDVGSSFSDIRYVLTGYG